MKNESIFRLTCCALWLCGCGSGGGGPGGGVAAANAGAGGSIAAGAGSVAAAGAAGSVAGSAFGGQATGGAPSGGNVGELPGGGGGASPGGSASGSSAGGAAGLSGSGGEAGTGGAVASGGALGAGDPNATDLSRHDALYCGEWQKTTKPGDTIYLVKGGKVVWSYSLNTSGGNEYGDCTLTSYGTVFFPLKETGAFEIKVDPAKTKGSEADIVWSYHQDTGSEVHSVQPIGKDKVMVMQNGNPAKLMLIDKTAAKDCRSKDACVLKTWNPDSGGQVHGMFRHVRMLANGNLLVPYTGTGSPSSGHVKEYTPDWKVVWDYDTGGSPWAAVRLHNGNTLISGNAGAWFREVSPDMKIVWEVTKADLPSTLYYAQGAQRLANGNTLLANWCGPAATGEWANTTQYWEITPDKKLVWSVKSWTDPNLGPGSSIQALDEAGVPEMPGELMR